MKCEYCNKDIADTYGSGRFCNIKCSRGFASKEKRLEINEKVSKSLKGIKWPKDKKYNNYRNGESRTKSSNSLKKYYKEKRDETPFEKLRLFRKKERIFKEQNYKCLLCGQGEVWNSIRLVLQLDHIDGNNKNDVRENLRVLCPNCHTQTPTYVRKTRL